MTTAERRPSRTPARTGYEAEVEAAQNLLALVATFTGKVPLNDEQSALLRVCNALITLNERTATVLRWIEETGCTCSGDYWYASLEDHENGCPAQVEAILIAAASGPSTPEEKHV